MNDTQKPSNISDLLIVIKRLCVYLMREEPDSIDDLRLDTALRILQIPHFNTKMNGLKEIIRILEEAESAYTDTIDKNFISKEKVLQWLKAKEVLPITLAGLQKEYINC